MMTKEEIQGRLAKLVQEQGEWAFDILAAFKQGFGGNKLTLSCLKQIYDRVVYTTLCARAGADPADRTGYFPAYRSSKNCGATA